MVIKEEEPEIKVTPAFYLSYKRNLEDRFVLNPDFFGIWVDDEQKKTLMFWFEDEVKRIKNSH